MMTLEEIKKALQDRNLSRVAASTGISYNTVLKVANSKSKRVSYETVRALSAYLRQNP